MYSQGPTRRARYDADGHLVELYSTWPDRSSSELETHVWKDGLERSARNEQPPGSIYWQTEWSYDSERRVTRRTVTSRGGPKAWFDYTYDTQGRLSQVVRDSDSPYGQVLTSTYSYDPEGRLLSIDNDGICGSQETRCAKRTYWPNGRLKSDWWGAGRSKTVQEEYNERGQLSRTDRGHDEGTDSSTYAYDAKGRQTRWRQSVRASMSDIELLETTVYDPAGQRVRLAWNLRSDFSGTDNSCGPRRWRVTHRITYFCGTQLVALDEWDNNEDGIVDAWRTHERDATGQLVHEAYSGPPGLDTEPILRDFRYDCP